MGIAIMHTRHCWQRLRQHRVVCMASMSSIRTGRSLWPAWSQCRMPWLKQSIFDYAMCCLLTGRLAAWSLRGPLWVSRQTSWTHGTPGGENQTVSRARLRLTSTTDFIHRLLYQRGACQKLQLCSVASNLPVAKQGLPKTHPHRSAEVMCNIVFRLRAQSCPGQPSRLVATCSRQEVRPDQKAHCERHRASSEASLT